MAPTETGKQTKSVLVVEDNPLNAKLYRELLESVGLVPNELTNGREVLPAVTQERPDLIILDIQLPGMNGFEVAAALKGDESLKSIPIVIVTAFVMKGDEDKAREIGCDAFLTKPIPAETFLETVARLL